MTFKGHCLKSVPHTRLCHEPQCGGRGCHKAQRSRQPILEMDCVVSAWMSNPGSSVSKEPRKGKWKVWRGIHGLELRQGRSQIPTGVCLSAWTSQKDLCTRRSKKDEKLQILDQVWSKNGHCSEMG